MKISNSTIQAITIILTLGLGLFQFSDFYDFSLNESWKITIEIVLLAILLVALFVLYKRKVLFFQSNKKTPILVYMIVIIILALAIIYPNVYSSLKFKEVLKEKEAMIKNNSVNK